ncbi:MAG TPA: glycosyltransferase family 9 protein [Kofleriaceae bacterium]|jgi:ADP-heptose:LPS heptosyltransferase|nr:glycosyltransferase family 9 protein [Kofleriaceae bacterium]
MDVELMRRLDRVLGDAACSVLATAHRMRKPFVAIRPVRKIAVMKFFGMGSIIVASRSLAALRDSYPGAEIHFVTFAGNRGILDILDMTDHNHYVDPSTPQAFVKTTLAVAAALRRARCDLVLDLEFFAKFPLVLGSLAGIPQKAGFYLTSENWRRELLDITGFYNAYFHTSDIFLSLVYLCATGDYYYLNFNDWAAKYRYPQIEPGEIERAQLRSKLAGHGIGRGDPLFVINANTSPDLAPEARKWPKERYAQLADELAGQTPGARVCFIGAPNERAYVQSIAELCRTPRRHVLAGELSLRELLVLFAEAKLVVSNDSGPMHMTCLVDAPVVGLFFADTPTLFAPLGTRVRCVAPPLYSIPLFSVYNGKDVAVGKPSSEIGNAAACAVSLDTVMTQVRELLAQRPVLRSSDAGRP